MRRYPLVLLLLPLVFILFLFFGPPTLLTLVHRVGLILLFILSLLVYLKILSWAGEEEQPAYLKRSILFVGILVLLGVSLWIILD